MQILTVSGSAKNWEEAIALCGEKMSEYGYVELPFADECILREKEFPTGIPSEIPIAIPHAKSANIKKDCICLLRLDSPVIFNRMDSTDESVEVELVLNLALRDSGKHLVFLQKLMSIVQDVELLDSLRILPLDKLQITMEEKLSNI
jgi:PTS system galactitol-specific IIA component